MSQQNLLSVGFDVAGLQAQAVQVEQIVQKLYADLKAMDSVKLSPIDITGLQQLTQSIKDQQTQMNNLGQSIVNLNNVMNNYNNTLNNANATQAKTVTSVNNSTNAINNNTKATQANTNAQNQSTQASNAANSAANQSNKNATKQLDLLKQLKEKRTDLNRILANSGLGSNLSAAQVKQVEQQLKLVNQQIGDVEKNLQRANSTGIANMGRGLNSVMGSVRQIAYILPGLGIAGIFNLAFEAIVKVVEAMGFFNSRLDQTIEFEKKLAESFEKTNEILKDRADIFAKRGDEETDYYQRMKALQEAQGTSYEGEFQQIDELNTARANSAKQNVENLNATYGESRAIDTKLITLWEQRKKTAEKIAELEKGLFEKQGENVGTGAPITSAYGAIKKAGQVAAFEENIETLKKTLAGFDAEANAYKKRQADINGALKEETDANLAILEEAEKRGKYFYDQAREKQLSNAERTFQIEKQKNEKIINNQFSTQKEIKEAYDNQLKAEGAFANAKLQFALSAREISPAQETKAINDNYVIQEQNKKEHDEKLFKQSLDFWVKQLALIHQSNELDILMNQITDKTILENDQETYDKRMSALSDYTNDRERAAYEQYQYGIELARGTMAGDALGAKELQLRKEYNKQILDAENGLRKEAYDIAKSWFDKQMKLIKDDADNNRVAEENEATQELLALQTQFNNKEIRYKDFAIKRQKIEEQSAKDIADAKVADDKQEIDRLVKLQNDIGSELRGATENYSIALIFGSKKDVDIAKGQMDLLSEKYKATGKDIADANAEMSKDQLKALELRSKLEEDARKQTAANWKQLEEEAFKGVQQIVDSYFEDRIAKLEALTEAQDKATDAEIEAIERSTLSAKEKNAYEVQLNAQKTARDEEMARKEKKIKHDQAVFDRDLAMSQIILNTAVAITGALKIPGPVGVGLAISYGALGAAQLAIAAATKIPEYAKGGTHDKDGLAIFGEAGKELVKEPHKKPYIADRPTLGFLSAGTELFPMYDIPQFPERRNDGWAQTMYLGKQIAKSKREIKNVFKPKITVDLGKELYIRRILHG